MRRTASAGTHDRLMISVMSPVRARHVLTALTLGAVWLYYSHGSPAVTYRLGQVGDGLRTKLADWLPGPMVDSGLYTPLDKLVNTSMPAGFLRGEQQLYRATFDSFPPSPPLDRLTELVTREDRAVYDRLLRDWSAGGPMRETCGKWQADYAANHAKARAKLMRGEDVPYVVFACMQSTPGYGECGGLADRTKGIISALLLAIFLDRPFFLYFDNDDPIKAESAFVSPFINWLWEWPRQPELSDGWLRRMTWDGWNTFAPDFIERDLAGLEELAHWRHTLVHSNLGVVLRTVDTETYSGRRMREMGFTGENVYGCLLNYLWRPIPYTMDRIAEYAAIMAHPSVFSIALQIRTLDTEMASATDLVPEAFAAFFGCAATLAQVHARPEHRHFVVFVASDFGPLREQVAVDMSPLIPDWSHPTLGPPIGLVAAGMHPMNIDLLSDAGEVAANETVRQYNMQTTLLDHYAIDAADYRIISDWSGFGALSALRTWNRTGGTALAMRHVMNPRQWATMPPQTSETYRTCDDPTAPLTLHDMGQYYWA